MDRFPPELLHNIFIQLDLEQRLRCTLVCRSWWSALDRYSLLFNVKMDKGSDQFDRFMNMITRSPHRAAQVEELTLYVRFKKEFNKRTLCSTFPNLRCIRLGCGGIDRHFSEPIEVTHTTSKIQRIYDRQYCEYTLQMSASNLCLQLETLVLDFSSYPLPCPAIVRQLKNMPVLKNLRLGSPELSVVDMDIMHDNVPSIQTLKLSGLTILDSDMPTNIIPATFLINVEFEISRMDISDSYCRWYLYMSKKYVNVKQWRYNDENHGFLEENAERFYKNGFLQFMELIAPIGPYLSLDYIPANVDVFQALDKVGARIEDFEFRSCEGDQVLQSLAKSNQSTYVTDILFMYSNFDSFHNLQSLTSLTTLNLESIFGTDPEEINLTDCFNSLPNTLKKLSIIMEDYEVDPIHCNLSFIQNLLIWSTEIRQDLADTISTCFPKLVELEVSGHVNDTLKIALPSRCLKSAIFKSRSLKEHGISFKCPAQVKPQYYLFNDNNNAARVTYEQAKEKHILSIVSHTKKSLKITSDTILISSTLDVQACRGTRNPGDIYRLIPFPPALKHLSIETNRMIFEPFKASLDSFETLNIRCHAYSSVFGDIIISFCFPNMVELILLGDVFMNIDITLKSPHLQKAACMIRQ